MAPWTELDDVWIRCRVPLSRQPSRMLGKPAGLAWR